MEELHQKIFLNEKKREQLDGLYEDREDEVAFQKLGTRVLGMQTHDRVVHGADIQLLKVSERHLFWINIIL